MRFIALACCCLFLSACPLVYRIDVQQGNYVTQDVLDKLKVGMTKTEVRQLLGTPLLNDVFHNDRWDYLFTNSKAGRKDDGKRITVLFKDDKVVSFSGVGQPPALPPVVPAASPAATAPAATTPAATTPAAPSPAATSPAAK